MRTGMSTFWASMPCAPCASRGLNDLGLLRVAFEAIVSAVGREQLEKERDRLEGAVATGSPYGNDRRVCQRHRS